MEIKNAALHIPFLEEQNEYLCASISYAKTLFNSTRWQP